MKVSCLTFHDSTNYGTVLQAYALQTVVSEMGHEYEIINYSTPEKRKHDTVFGRNREMSVLQYLYKLSNAPQNLYKTHLFRRFTTQHLKITRRFYAMDQLREYAADRDAILAGSDQVWNSEMVREDSAYFLKFTEPKKRASYAASLGISRVSSHQRSFYQEMLSDFERISVREPTGAQLIGEMTGKPVRVVLDPTLLLTKEEWARICLTPPKRPYIFAYILERNPQAQIFLRKLQAQTGLPVRYVTRGYVSALRDGAAWLPSPQKWVTQLMNAAYVVTSSFHGTAFSVNFQKNFFTFVNGDPTDSRQTDFLRSMGLYGRLNPDYTGVISLTSPDFQQAKTVLAEERIASKAWLKNALLEIAGRDRL